MLYQLAVLAVDIGLGALAYKLAKGHAPQIADLRTRLSAVEDILQKVLAKCPGLQV